ncbi:MAG: MBL fold metallo-hydrolase [Candidatus Binatus sp.]|jgi:flavorubredoxin
METRVDEIAEKIYRLSTLVPGTAGPAGLTFNQFLIDADEPLLFHCGQRFLFPSISSAVGKLIPIERLRWITFSHVESDECGSMNEWLAAAPKATAAHGHLGCNIWLKDTAIREPRALSDGEVLDLGGKKVRRLDTPHLPHCWDAGLIYEEATGTLFCSDMFTQAGDGPALADGDIVGPAIEIERRLAFTPITPKTAPMVRKLAALSPRTLAVMHGSSFSGDVSSVLEALAGFYDEVLRAG